MKALLILSLLINGLLAYRLTSRPEVITQEKVVVKKAKPQVVERKVYVEVPAPEKSEAVSTTPTMATVEFDQKDMDDLVSEVSRDRDDFLTGTLGLTPKDLQKIKEVKEAFNRRYQKAIPATHFGELTIEQRRQLLELDVERENEFMRVIGEKKWKKFQGFKDAYNRRMFSRQVNEKGIIIPMEI